jgi:hypothetical protein
MKRLDINGMSRALSGMGNRRQGLGAMVGALLASLTGTPVGAGGIGAEQCIPVARRCGKNSKSGPCRHSCSGYATSHGRKHRCTCRPDGTPCANTAQCCNGRCAGGTCFDTCVGFTSFCNPAVDVCCTTGAVCQKAPGAMDARCCYLSGFPCSGPADCCTGFCNAQRRCTFPPPPSDDETDDTAPPEADFEPAGDGDERAAL